MHTNLERITEEMNNIDLTKYWPEFESVAYAFYDNKVVYLYNHPKFTTPEENLHILSWNEQFLGNTLILYEDYPTSIINTDYYEDFESLYAILVHELFHGHQFLKEEKRFPDEMKGITYPLSQENVELRNQEREHLYQAVFAATRDEKRRSLQQFMALREKRKCVIEESLLYENLIETVEGPAWYVELNAYAEKSSLSYDCVLHKYGESLLDKDDSCLNIRKSCYSSGLFLCLLLDEISPGWKEHFLDSDNSLYDFLKQNLTFEIMPVANVVISQETVDILRRVIEARENEFLHFSERTGYHLYIEGEMSSRMIDPMNLVSSENKLLHTNFMKVMINHQDYLFQIPVITHFQESHRKINKLHVVLDEQPVESKGLIQIKGVGEIVGHFYKKDEVFYLVVDG